ncbi:MAG: hypothetical protein EAX96_08425 [Candidatus Lokiarchaeota archaeon]|nr:hypothetical protein [Candidatus Lokiarchaeota archaeon]
MSEPKIIKVIHPEGQIPDELDWEVTKYLMQMGIGYTPCKPSMVEIEGGKQAIKLMIDKTAVRSDGVYGFGIIGSIFLEIPKSPTDLRIIYVTPKEELETKGNQLLETIEPQKRPKRY